MTFTASSMVGLKMLSRLWPRLTKYGTTGKEISSNLTDNESAKMKTAHGVIQGYNSQALIDAKHRVIIHGEAFGNGQDYAHGPPRLEGAR